MSKIYEGPLLTPDIYAIVEEWRSKLVWRPIETAPMDGTRIILFTREDLGDGPFVGEGWWCEKYHDEAGEGWNLKGEFSTPRRIEAHAWMPLPKPPSS